MAILSTSNLVGQKYNCIIIKKDLDLSKPRQINFIIQAFIFSSGRERELNQIEVLVSDSMSLSEIQDEIYDEIIRYCEKQGWPIDRTDIISI